MEFLLKTFALASFTLGSIAYAGSITKSHTFSSGATASASQVNDNFDQLFTEMNAKETRMTTLESSTFLWLANGARAYYNGGNVGVGTSTPTGSLQVTGALNVAMEPNAFGTSNNYTALVVGATTGAVSDNGGLYAIGRRDKTNEPYVAMSGWDDGSNRTIYYGGGGWGAPDAMLHRLYTAAAYSEVNDAGVERMRITADGNVGIGSTAPGNNLTISANVDDTVPALGANGGKFGILRSNGYGMIMGQINTGKAFIQVQRVDGTATAYDLMLQPNGGNVGIANLVPAYKLDVTGEVNASLGYQQVSDARLKTNVQPLTGSLEKIRRLQGVHYEWLDKQKFGPGTQLGLLAQDVEKEFPEAVKERMGQLSLNYPVLVAPIIEAIKELFANWQSQEARLQSLEAHNQKLERELAQMTQRMQALEKAQSRGGR